MEGKFLPGKPGVQHRITVYRFSTTRLPKTPKPTQSQLDTGPEKPLYEKVKKQMWGTKWGTKSLRRVSLEELTSLTVWEGIASWLILPWRKRMGIEPTWERLHAPTPDLKSGSPTSELGASEMGNI